MMDSTLILELFESRSEHSLWSRSTRERQIEAQTVSLALAACEKSVQAVYELNLRPKERHHGPWLKRIAGQRAAAFTALERNLQEHAELLRRTSHASIASAIALQFGHAELGALVDPADYPHLTRLAEHLEGLPVFQKYPPVGPGVRGS